MFRDRSQVSFPLLACDHQTRPPLSDCQSAFPFPASASSPMAKSILENGKKIQTRPAMATGPFYSEFGSIYIFFFHKYDIYAGEALGAF